MSFNALNETLAVENAGYRDLNLCIELELPGGATHVCEVQLNVKCVLEAKDRAHEHYEKVRSILPEACYGTNADANVVEALIMKCLPVGLQIGAPATIKSYEDFFSKKMRKKI